MTMIAARPGMRIAAVVAGTLSVLAVAGCYEYKPIEAQALPVGEAVSLQISDQGRVGLADRFGPGLAEVQGRLVSNQGNEYVLNVFRVSQLNGESSAWSGEMTRLDRSFVGTVKGRSFSPFRTTLLTITAGTAAYFILGRQLVGSFSGGHEETPPDSMLRHRLPPRITFRFRF